MDAAKKPLLSVIIPVYNEKNTVWKMIEKVYNVEINKEIIVVCDGSADGTREVLKELEKKGKFRKTTYLYHKKNLGKGAAVRTGLDIARGEITIVQDADLEQDPGDYHALIKPIVSGKEKVVFGSRFKSSKPKLVLLSKIANMVVTFLANALYDAGITDAACGYKVMPTSLYRSLNLKSSGFDICPETIVKLKKRKIPIYEVPVKFFPRGKKSGKKIKWQDGFVAVYSYFKYLFIWN